MAVPQGLFVPTDINKPKPVGVCDDCGFLYPMSQLAPQMQWRGNALAWNGALVCTRTCLNVPSEFLRPAILGPEPVPPRYPRPTNYAVQNQGGVPGLNTTQEILGDEDIG